MSTESRLAVLERDTKATNKNLSDIDLKHEKHRDKVHDRINESHNLYNSLRIDAFKSINELTRRLDGVEHDVQNIDKIFDKFVVKVEDFVKEMTLAITKLEKTMDKSKTGKEIAIGMAVFIMKLGSFAATMIGILKFIEKL